MSEWVGVFTHRFGWALSVCAWACVRVHRYVCGCVSEYVREWVGGCMYLNTEYSHYADKHLLRMRLQRHWHEYLFWAKILSCVTAIITVCMHKFKREFSHFYVSDIDNGDCDRVLPRSECKACHNHKEDGAGRGGCWELTCGAAGWGGCYKCARGVIDIVAEKFPRIPFVHVREKGLTPSLCCTYVSVFVPAPYTYTYIYMYIWVGVAPLFIYSYI